MFKLFCGLVFLLFLFSGCNREMQYILDRPSFSGTVLEVFDDAILVRSWGNFFIVSRDFEAFGVVDFMSSDEVTVYYDGVALEGNPAQVLNVYAITLTEPSRREVWFNTVSAEVVHAVDGQSATWAVNNQSGLDELYSWFTGLTLTRMDGLFMDNFVQTYEFTIYDDNLESFVFFYGTIDFNDNWYLYFDGLWFEVSNPSLPNILSHD